MGDDQYVSTGAAAKLLGVTPDTVLKWIKRGRLAARRTAGGHFRIARADLSWLRGDDDAPVSAELSSPPSVSVAVPLPVYCWEYHAAGGEVRAACEQCKAYQAKALRCFELRCLPSGMGSPNDFCATTCDVCGYYRERVQGPVRVLVVSDSVSLREELQRGVERRPIQFEFTAREYECASIVESFRPEFALIDCSLPRATWTSLTSCMAEDRRASGIRIVLLAARRAKRGDVMAPSGATVHAQLSLPLDWSVFEGVLGLGRASPQPGLTTDSGRRRGRARKANAV